MNDVFTLIVVLGSSAFAIGLLVVLNMLVGGWAPARFTDEAAAAQAFRDGVFGFTPETVVLDADRTAALALEAGGERLGVAVAMGDVVSVRALRRNEVCAVSREGARLDIRLPDYTFPSAELRFADAPTAERWAQIVSDFQRAGTGAGRRNRTGASHA